MTIFHRKHTTMPLEHIWLISGYAGSGKDTTATILVNLLGSTATRSSFAGSVKDEVAAMYEVERSYLDTQAGKAHVVQLADGTQKTLRELIIAHAESTKQQTHKGIWADRLAAPNTTHWILSDWRFLEELFTLRRRFPTAIIHTIRVRRAEIIPSTSYTEHELDDFAHEYTIDNCGSLLYIGNQLKDIVETLLCP
jgi:hypothetical protein